MEKTIIFRQLLLCSILFLVIGTTAVAQSNEPRFDVFYMTDGTEYKGHIVREIHGYGIEIRTLDGRYIEIRNSDLQSSIKNTTQSNLNLANNIVALAYGFSEGLLHIEGGYSYGFNREMRYSESGIFKEPVGSFYSLRLIIKRQFGRSNFDFIFTDGMDISSDGSFYVPFLFGTRYNFDRDSNAKPFIQATAGAFIGVTSDNFDYYPLDDRYTYQSTNLGSNDLAYGWTYEISAGIMTKIKNTALGFSLGYSYLGVNTSIYEGEKIPFQNGFFRISIGRAK